MKISPRLSMIAEIVDSGARVIDVGCDHAYISAYLIQNGICEIADASDIRPGPLKRAAGTLQKYGLTNRVKMYLTAGLEGIPESGYDTIIIAGMGGETISDIIDGCGWIKNSGVRLILNPMTADEHLRQYLFENGFKITNERLAQEETKLYVCIKAEYDGVIRRYERHELVFTDKMDRNNPLFKKYIKNRIACLVKRRDGLKKKSAEADAEILQCQADIDALSGAL